MDRTGNKAGFLRWGTPNGRRTNGTDKESTHWSSSYHHGTVLRPESWLRL